MGDLAGEVRPGIRALHVEAEEGNRRADAKGQQQADAEGAEGQAVRQGSPPSITGVRSGLFRYCRVSTRATIPTGAVQMEFCRSPR